MKNIGSKRANRTGTTLINLHTPNSTQSVQSPLLPSQAAVNMNFTKTVANCKS